MVAQAVSKIMKTVMRICIEKNIDPNTLLIERTKDHTFYLSGRKVLLIVEWEGFNVNLIE